MDEIKLFVGAVCKRNDGNIVQITFYDKKQNAPFATIGGCNRYFINGKNKGPDELSIIEILNPEANYNKDTYNV